MFRISDGQTVRPCPPLVPHSPKIHFAMSVVSTLSQRGIITISLPFFPSNHIFSQTQSSSAVTDPLLPATISAAASPPVSHPLPPSLLTADDQAWGCELRSFAGGVWWKKSEAWGGSSLLIRDKCWVFFRFFLC